MAEPPKRRAVKVEDKRATQARMSSHREPVRIEARPEEALRRLRDTSRDAHAVATAFVARGGGNAADVLARLKAHESTIDIQRANISALSGKGENIRKVKNTARDVGVALGIANAEAEALLAPKEGARTIKTAPLVDELTRNKLITRQLIQHFTDIRDGRAPVLPTIEGEHEPTQYFKLAELDQAGLDRVKDVLTKAHRALPMTPTTVERFVGAFDKSGRRASDSLIEALRKSHAATPMTPADLADKVTRIHDRLNTIEQSVEARLENDRASRLALTRQYTRQMSDEIILEQIRGLERETGLDLSSVRKELELNTAPFWMTANDFEAEMLRLHGAIDQLHIDMADPDLHNKVTAPAVRPDALKTAFLGATYLKTTRVSRR